MNLQEELEKNIDWFENKIGVKALTDYALGKLSAYKEVVKLIKPEVNSTLQVLPIEEQLTKITKEIHILEDSYINADECGDISAKKYIGNELKRLKKELENL